MSFVEKRVSRSDIARFLSTQSKKPKTITATSLYLKKRRSEKDKYIKAIKSTSSPLVRQKLFEINEARKNRIARAQAESIFRRSHASAGDKVLGFLSTIRNSSGYATPRASSLRGSYGKRGRPPGPSGRYTINGQPVDVYTYRKYLAQQNALQRIRVQQQTRYSPIELARIRAIEAQQQAPENQPIPDTRGQFNMSAYMKEAEDAANVVP